MAVLIVTTRFFCSPEYCRMMVKVSWTSLSTPRFERRKAVTDAGRPKRTRAWSMVWVPGIAGQGQDLNGLRQFNSGQTRLNVQGCLSYQVRTPCPLPDCTPSESIPKSSLERGSQSVCLLPAPHRERPGSPDVAAFESRCRASGLAVAAALASLSPRTFWKENCGRTLKHCQNLAPLLC